MLSKSWRTRYRWVAITTDLPQVLLPKRWPVRTRQVGLHTTYWFKIERSDESSFLRQLYQRYYSHLRKYKGPESEPTCVDIQVRGSCKARRRTRRN